MRTNTAERTARTVETTHEGAPVRSLNAELRLRRTLMTCLLWEDNFYEDGVSVATRIREYVHACTGAYTSLLGVEARADYRIRHTPLLVCRELARHPDPGERKFAGPAIANVISRADELAEFVAIWGDGKADVKLSAQAKKGLARAFLKFDAYQLAKYNRKAPVTLRDVMFMVHPKPKDKAQQEIFKQLASNTLPAPDTWEVGLSTGADKGETFTRLLTEKKLGYMALLRNLRNMVQAQVDRDLIREALVAGAYKSKALPFRFVSAAKHAPEFEPELDNAMQAAMSGLDRLDGSTAVLIDVSGSMDAALSKRSEMTRREAGAALAILVGGVCDRWDCFIFGDVCVQFPARANLSLVEKVREVNKQSYYHFLDHGEKRDRYTVGHGTNIGHAVKQVNDTYDRIIVVTDCQSHDALPNPKGKGYIINTAPYKNGVGYGPWTMIDGFSEATVRFISEVERD